MHVKANRDWLVLANIPFRGELLTEPLHLKDTRDNRRAAEAKLRRVEAEVLACTFNYAAHFPTSSRLERLGLKVIAGLTLAELAREWLAENENLLSGSTAQHYRVMLKNHLFPHPIAGKRLLEVSDGDVKKLIGKLQSQVRGKPVGGDADDQHAPGPAADNLRHGEARELITDIRCRS